MTRLFLNPHEARAFVRNAPPRPKAGERVLRTELERWGAVWAVQIHAERTVNNRPVRVVRYLQQED